MLHHTLPKTLSQLIIAGRSDLIQDVLDSTYGLFGIVVTDPSGQSLLYQTSKIYHRGSWQDKLSPDALAIEAKRERLTFSLIPASGADVEHPSLETRDRQTCSVQLFW